MSFAHDDVGTTSTAWRSSPGWSDVAPLDLAGVDTVVVLAAHPDDETLGAGGLVATAHRRGLAVRVVIATAGEASHPASPTHPPERLARVRRAEAADAVDRLAPGTDPLLLDLPDGAVADVEDVVVARLVDVVGDGRRTLLVAPWRRDGHPDHEAVGRAAAVAAVRTGARLVEYPVWFWHWARPADAPWPRLRAFDLDHAGLVRKLAAVAAHRSQVAPLSSEPGDETLLGPGLLEHFTAPRELYVVEPAHDPALDDLQGADPDPWGVDRRRYEQRKRDLLLAALPAARYRRVLEVGCSTGALAEALAGRCDELVAVDDSVHAVEHAARRLGGLDHVRVERCRVPEQWPSADSAGGSGFDLVVVSEVGYFLSPAALDRLAERVRDSLSADGVVLLCHWRHEVAGWVLDGPEVHARFVAAGVRPLAAEYRDRDVELLVLADPDRMPDPRE